MNGKLISVDWAELSSFLAFSHASWRRLQGHGILPQVDALLALEFIGHVVDQHLVDVVATEVAVAVGADDPEDAVGHLQDGDVERPAAEVEHGDLLVPLAVQSVGERRGGRLVDDARDFKPGNLPGIFGGLPLGVVEVGRYGDDGLVDLVTEIRFGGFLQLPQHMRGNLGGVRSLSAMRTFT